MICQSIIDGTFISCGEGGNFCSPVCRARCELEAAALVVGDKFATETDATWDECQRFERAALEYRNAFRAAQPCACGHARDQHAAGAHGGCDRCECFDFTAKETR